MQLMISNLYEYFEPQQEYYLENISYNKLNNIPNVIEYAINVVDNVDVNLLEEGVEVIVGRKIFFDPNGVFELTVSFGANLHFNEEKKNEYNWDEINIENEFIKYGDFVIGNLISHISMLIANITASFGQPPMMLPPKLVGFNIEK